MSRRLFFRPQQSVIEILPQSHPQRLRQQRLSGGQRGKSLLCEVGERPAGIGLLRTAAVHLLIGGQIAAFGKKRKEQWGAFCYA